MRFLERFKCIHRCRGSGRNHLPLGIKEQDSEGVSNWLPLSAFQIFILKLQ